MAAKKQSSAKKTASSRSTAKKKPAAKKAQPTFFERNRTVLMLCYLLLALFLFAVAFIPGYRAWTVVRGGCFALFGVGFFVFDLCLFVIGVRLALNSLKRKLWVTTLAAVLLTAVFSSAVHLVLYRVGDGSFGDQLADAAGVGYGIGQGEYHWTGGILGALLGGGLLHTVGKAGGFVLLALILAAAILIYFNLSAVQVGDRVSHAINTGKTRIDATHAANQQRRIEHRELKLQRAAEAARLAEEQARLEEEQARAENFAFERTEVELEDGFRLRKRRTPKPYVSQNRLFTYVEPNGTEPPTVIGTDNLVTPPDEPVTLEKLPADGADPETDQTDGDARKIVDAAVRQADKAARKNRSEVKDFKEEKPRRRDYTLPPIDCLNAPDFARATDLASEIQATSQKLVDTLKSFGVETKLSGVSCGPSVTRYELQPAPGVKISKITSLADDIALNLASSGVRIEAPIPNKSAVGIEVPNQTRASVTLREIISSSEFQNAKSKLNVALGKDITGNVNCTDLAKMPHLLIAGTTGSGKSVCLNCMICSILYNAKPDEVKLLMIDPKQVEFSVYNGIPHLLVPVISDVRKAAGSLAWAVGEMEKRYRLFSTCGVRDIGGFNKYVAAHPETPELEVMPQIVIFIDELNDLMMVSPKEVEDSICRLAQKARAAGMHLVVATQRPSVDVITGIIKANIPSRLSLSVSSQVDSRTILDCVGAEKLLGNGDMLFNPVGISKPVRIQGAYVSESEIEKIIDFIKAQSDVEYSDEISDAIEQLAVADKKKALAAAGDEVEDADGDPMIQAAIETVVDCQAASTTLLQRKLRLGYARAARIMDELEQRHVVGPADGSKPRKVLMTKAQLQEMLASKDYADAPDSDDVPFDDADNAEDFDIFGD
ncbi:MAG: DNA translocase FtsK [Clostridia bacterium]|nr:DNA translocase FtsK [Clostridia bacterium]